MFRINLFGVPTLSGPDGPLVGRGTQRHRLALLAQLAVAGPRGLSRERVSGLLWPDAESDRAARRLLSDSIYRINQALGAEGLVAEGEGLRIDPSVLGSDVEDFRRALAAREWSDAAELHHAPLMDGFVLNSLPFERWLETERRRLQRERMTALEELATAADATDPASAVAWWRQLAAEDPLSSRVAVLLMRALARQGERAAAVQHAQVHAALVREELALDPSPDVIELADELRSAAAARTPTPTQTHATQPAAAVHPEPRETPAPPPDPPPLAVPAGRALRDLWRAVAAAAVALVLFVAWVGLRSPNAAEQPIRSIAVLPFADGSPDGGQEFFADGITDELISRLARIEGLRVVSRTSSFAFKGRAIDVRQIGRDLDVGAVLEGSVRQSDERLRVSVQLIDTDDGFELWSETFERSVDDALAVQDEIAQTIAARMGGDPQVPQLSQTPSTLDPTALNLYLSGRFEWHKRSAEGLAAAARLFQEATERSPEFARAHAGLGDAYAVQGFYDYLPPGDAFPRATAAAERALELDASLGEAYATLGYAALYYDWDEDSAEEAFRRAIELSPSYSTGHQWLANLYVASGRVDEAIRAMRAAQELDPLSRIASGALGFVYYMGRRYDDALAQLEQTLALDPRFEVAHLWSGWVLEEMDRADEAVAAYERAVAESGSAIARAALAHGLVGAGRGVDGRALLTELEAEAARGYAPAYDIAKVYVALDEPGRALDWLQRAIEERSHSMVFLAVDPQWDELRGEPRFTQLLEAVPVAVRARERLREANSGTEG